MGAAVDRLALKLSTVQGFQRHLRSGKVSVVRPYSRSSYQHLSDKDLLETCKGAQLQAAAVGPHQQEAEHILTAVVSEVKRRKLVVPDEARSSRAAKAQLVMMKAFNAGSVFYPAGASNHAFALSRRGRQQ